jgi:hypothetical protein
MPLPMTTSLMGRTSSFIVSYSATAAGSSDLDSADGV